MKINQTHKLSVNEKAKGECVQIVASHGYKLKTVGKFYYVLDCQGKQITLASSWCNLLIRLTAIVETKPNE